MRIVFLLFIFAIIASCNGSKKNNTPVTRIDTKEQISFSSGIIINDISTKKTPSISYSLYLPKSYDTTTTYPILFFFDAHARGSLPLNLYSSLADKYEIILVGSSNSKNGLSQQVLADIVNATMNDALQKFSIDTKQIYTGGFSGGAKVASMAALGSKQIKHVISCAAPMPQEMVSMPLTFNYTAIAGIEDFNLKDMAAQEIELKSTKHELLFYKGKHNWPPANIMDKVIRSVVSSAMLENRKEKNEAFIHETKKMIADSLLHISFAKQQIEAEEQLQQKYIESLTTKDYNWWKSEVAQLNKKFDTLNTQTYIYKRVLNYISMVCYIYTNKAIADKQLQQAGYFVDVYELVDKKNPDVYYLKATLFSSINNKEAVIENLKKCAEYGFSDLEKLMSDPAFKEFSSTPEFEEIISSVSGNISK